MLHNRLLRIAPGYSVMTLTYRYVELPPLARKRSTRVSPPAEEAVTRDRGGRRPSGCGSRSGS